MQQLSYFFTIVTTTTTLLPNLTFAICDLISFIYIRLQDLRPYFIAFPIWSLLGYYIHHFELRQEELVQSRHMLLKRNRRLLEDKDFDNLPLTQAFKEKRDARLKAEAGQFYQHYSCL
jgi:hypothetical protein